MNVKFPIPDFLFQERLASNYKMSAFSLPPDFIFAFFGLKHKFLMAVPAIKLFGRNTKKVSNNYKLVEYSSLPDSLF